MAFSLLPDIDHPDSLFGRIFPFISKTIMHRYGHRSITHSVFSIGIVALLLIPVFFLVRVFYVPCLLSFCSHIFIDLFNKSGIRLLSPFSKKEFISFNTHALRIKTGGWQELLLMLSCLIFMISLSGKQLTLDSISYSFSKFFKKYESSYSVYQDYSPSVCTANLEYFNNTELRKINESLTILSMTSTNIFLIKNGSRVVLAKNDISKITVSKTEQSYNINQFKGNSLDDFPSLSPGSFVSGILFVKNFHPELQSSDFLKVTNSGEDTKIELTCAFPEDLLQLSLIDIQLHRKINEIKQQLPEYALNQLLNQQSILENQIHSLSKKGFYKNYTRLNELNKQLEKIQTQIETLKLNINTVSSEALEKELYKLEKETAVSYSVWVYK